MTVTTTTGAEVAIVDRPAGVLAVADSQQSWSPQQRAALDQLGLAGADEGNLAVFLHQAQRTGLDPFAKQIYMIGRNSKERFRNQDGSWSERWVTKYTIQTGINGYRTVARRGARRDGSSYTYGDDARKVPAAEWCDKDGVWRDSWVKTEPPAAARFTIVKTDVQGRVERFTATCRLGAYIQTNQQGHPTGRWAYAADQMLSKCAEALALQMGYPQDYAGVEYEGAMDHLDSEPRGAGGPPSARDRMAARATVIDDESANQTPPWEAREEYVDGLLTVIETADVDQWRTLNEHVAQAEREGLDGDALGILREALRARIGSLPASQRDLKRMHTALSALGITDPAQRKLAAGNVVGRTLKSTSELTGAEADRVWRRADEAMRDGGAAALLYPDGQPADDGASDDDDEEIPDGVGVTPEEAARLAAGGEA